MWIYKKNYDAINLNEIKCIEKIITPKTDLYPERYLIKFWYMVKDNSTYEFDSKDELENYYAVLMEYLDAKEISTLSTLKL